MIFKVEKVKCSFIPNMSLDDKGLARDEVRNKFTRQPDIKTRKHKCIKCWINHYRSIKMMLVLQGRHGTRGRLINVFSTVCKSWLNCQFFI